MTSGLRDRLVEALRERPSPVLMTDEGTIPAASLWIGARRWVRAFRGAGLGAGDRLVLALPPSAAFVEVLVAGLWEGLTVAPAPPGTDLDALLAELDAAVVVVPSPPAGTGPLAPGRWGADGCSGPNPRLAAIRATRSAPTPDVALLMHTSGTTGGARWVALSERNVCAVLDSHQPQLRLADAYVVSTLPWDHAFGLILDLLPALLAGAYIARDPDGGRDAAALAQLLRRAPAVLCAVPATISGLAGLPDGDALLAGLAGGIVGGASVGAHLAARLNGTSLRPGYGQTEASPGIALGEPGRWRAGLLGRPLGCEVRLVDGELEFRGDNACLGSWDEHGLHRLDPQRWVRSHDAVALVDGELIYRGRTVDRFKLANGRWVETTVLEPQVLAGLPLATDVLLFTADGSTLDVLVVGPRSPSLGPDDDGASAVRRLLGPIGALLGSVQHRAQDGVVRDAKGAINRAATVRLLLG